MNKTPMRREVAETIDALQSAVDRLRANHERIANESDTERAELIAEGREAIARARTNGSAWKIWQRILDEYETGSPDERGTEFDAIRRTASALDVASGRALIEPKVSIGVSYFPKTLEEATSVIDAFPDFRWRSRFGNIVGFSSDIDAGWVSADLITIFTAREIFHREAWDYARDRNPSEVEAESAEAEAEALEEVTA